MPHKIWWQKLQYFISTGASCSLNIDGNFYNPYSLFLICLDYVAKNVSMVESLAGFPDVVGEQLFHKVQESNGFHFCSKNLKLFCEAYGGLVLSQLSLTSEHIVTSNYLENLQLFVFLTELDVSHCHLGDSHDLLAFISHLQKWVFFTQRWKQFSLFTRPVSFQMFGHFTNLTRPNLFTDNTSN